MRRGDVFMARLAPRSGSEQPGRRPVIVLSHDGFNETPTWRSIIVVPVTTSRCAPHAGPTVVPLPAGSGGLAKASAVLCHQVTTLDRGKLGQRLGALSPRHLREVEEGVNAALDLP